MGDVECRIIFIRIGINLKALLKGGTMPFLNPLEEGLGEKPTKALSPTIIIIFGATGDLTARKLMPALYNLSADGQLPAHFACVAFARRDKTHEEFRENMKESVEAFSRSQPVNSGVWKNFADHLFYHRSEFDSDDGYLRLRTFLTEIDRKYGTEGNRIFYLATQPIYFPLIVQKLDQHGLTYPPQDPNGRWSRVIIEKPFGRDLPSANALQRDITAHLAEDQIYRIDHYLGKETVQNILVFRFANAIFDPIWNRKYIDHIQITVGEEQGIGTRGRLWEEQGMLRDIIQNHMMQLLSLVAMEPPVSLDADSVRNEKVKVIQSVRPVDMEQFDRQVIRGQYGKGYIAGNPVDGYREEKNVAPDSQIESYIAIQLFIDNWRWAGVPFYLRAGKRLPKRATEIAIIFRDIPRILFRRQGQSQETNVLVLRIQPDDGIALKINCKVPGLAQPIIQAVKMDFRYGSYFGLVPPEAYERLIVDCISGDKTLFSRVDEVLNSWRLFTPILERFQNTTANFPNYPAGSWGPAEADELLAQSGRSWRVV